MTPQIPVYLLSFESIVRLLVTIIALGLIWLGAARMPASAKSSYVTAGVLSAALIGWVAVAQYLGAANTYFAAADTAVPTVLFGLLIPLAVAAIALWRSDGIARLVSAIPLHWQFALPAGIGDVTTGIVAVVVAALLARNVIGAHRATYAWCLFGIADLVVAITMGAMTSPGRAHLLAFEAPNLLITSYPLVMVPTFAVPLALMLHGLVLWRLRRGTPATNRLVAA